MASKFGKRAPSVGRLIRGLAEHSRRSVQKKLSSSPMSRFIGPRPPAETRELEFFLLRLRTRPPPPSGLNRFARKTVSLSGSQQHAARPPANRPNLKLRPNPSPSRNN